VRNRVEFEELKEKYSSRVPAARRARNIAQLVDVIVKSELFERPAADYGVTLRAVLAADPLLRRVYGES
jgi:hypothetical protein